MLPVRFLSRRASLLSRVYARASSVLANRTQAVIDDESLARDEAVLLRRTRLPQALIDRALSVSPLEHGVQPATVAERAMIQVGVGA